MISFDIDFMKMARQSLIFCYISEKFTVTKHLHSLSFFLISYNSLNFFFIVYLKDLLIYKLFSYVET